MGAIEPRPEQGANRFGTASRHGKEAVNTVEPTPKPWSFSQPVLRKKTNRNRSVLVWSLVGSVAFAGVWSAVAPLQETVAVSGKLQPIQSVQSIETLIPGVVDTVLVSDGERVEAAVRLSETSHANAEELRRLCEAKVGAFKSPEKVHIRPELPKGPSGKIQRLYLNEMLYGA